MRRIPGCLDLHASRSTLVVALIAISILLCPASSSSIDIEISAEVTTDSQSTPNPWSHDESTTPPRIHDVSVGLFGDDRFQPRYVNAALGDRIRFSFSEGNHTVTESTFTNPCSAGGIFDTNFFHASDHLQGSNDVTIVVDTTNPRWFFCRQTVPTPHCWSGMVFAINPGSHWFEYVAQARNQSAAVSRPSSGLQTAGTSWRSTASGTSWYLNHPPPSSTLTVFEDATSTSTIATLTSTVNPQLTWSTVTITSMVTTTFSVSQ